MSAEEEIAAAISRATGKPFTVADTQATAGGSINQTLILAQGDRQYFVKRNRADRLAMFEAEAEGLKALAATATIRVPEFICHGSDETGAYLVLEALPLASKSAAAGAALGAALAAMHRCRGEAFGWHRDNTLGTTPQPNAWHKDWIAFLSQRRLRHQLDLLRDRELSAMAGPLFERLASMFDDYQPLPSLIHGDLWGGNWSALADDTPVIFDPACYYADREMELAMTELFGGFPTSFYEAYNQAWPLDPGYSKRKGLYLLYHVLNHANLFKGGYRGQALGLMHGLLETDP